MSGWLFFPVRNESTVVTARFHSRDRIVCYGTIANLDQPPAAPDGAALIIDESGATIGSIRVDQIITQFELADGALGSSVIALKLTVNNVTDEEWVFGAESIGLGDQIGRSFGRVIYDRSAASLEMFPELPERIPPGETITGFATILVWPNTELVELFYVPDEERIVVIGRADPTITMTGAEARELLAKAE